MSKYSEIFDAYVLELVEARTEVMEWWERLLEQEAADKDISAEEAYSNVRTRWPAGPTSHPRIIAVYRKYFLLCEAHNEEVRLEWDARNDTLSGDGESKWGNSDMQEIEGVIEPHYLLKERLNEHDEELGLFMEYMALSPIGTDEEGNAA